MKIYFTFCFDNSDSFQRIFKECHPRCVYQNYNGLIINNGSQRHNYI